MGSTGQEEADGGLYFAAAERVLLVVVRETRRLAGDALEDVVHEGVHDRHRLRADSRVGMHLLQHFVDVDRVRLVPLSPPPTLLALSCIARYQVLEIDF